MALGGGDSTTAVNIPTTTGVTSRAARRYDQYLAVAGDGGRRAAGDYRQSLPLGNLILAAKIEQAAPAPPPSSVVTSVSMQARTVNVKMTR